MLNNMDRLKVFFHVYTQRSVGRAADALHVTQPAVSQAIRKLEEEIGTSLFIRQHRRIIPTSAADRLHEVTAPFMENLATCLDTLHHGREEPHGELRIGAPPEFGKAYLPAMAAGFRQQYPGVTFYLKLGLTRTLMNLVGNGKLDFALVDLFLTDARQTSHSSLFHFEPVAEEGVLLVCSREYHDAHVNGEVTLEKLSKLDFIEYTRKNRTIEHWFAHHFNAPGTPFRTVMTVDNHDAVVSAIKHHAGLGVVASHLVDDELRSGEIVPITTRTDHILNRISLIHLQDKIPTLTEKTFKDHLTTEIGKLQLESLQAS